MNLDQTARYMDSHEWARKDGDEFVIGISDYAQESLSDIVYVELPEVGDTFERSESFGVVESVKAASDVYAPISGEVTAINEELEDAPELVTGHARTIMAGTPGEIEAIAREHGRFQESAERPAEARWFSK